MATRTAGITFDNIVEYVKNALIGGSDSVHVADVAKAHLTTTAVVMTVWNTADPDGKILDGDRGEMWLAEAQDAPSEPVVTVPNPAQRMAARRVAQTPVAPVDTPASEPVQSESLVNETSTDSEAETMTVPTTPAVAPTTPVEIVGQFDMNANEYPSDIEKNGLALDEPKIIPVLPEGVNANVWYMAHAAITQTARDSWMKRANAQRTEHVATVVAPLVVAGVQAATREETGF